MEEKTPMDSPAPAAAATKEIDELKARCDEYLNGWKRAKADFLNYQKEEVKRFEMIIKFSVEELVRELITVADSFELALLAHPAEKGFYLVQSQFGDILKKHGLEPMPVSVGQPFDPSRHEAVAEVASDQSANTIVEEVERGYTLHGKLVRPARVKVAK